MTEPEAARRPPAQLVTGPVVLSNRTMCFLCLFKQGATELAAGTPQGPLLPPHTPASRSVGVWGLQDTSSGPLGLGQRPAQDS